MGVVLRARSPEGGDVALKLILRPDADTLARFERERRLLASLGEAEGFVPLLDAGSAPEGTFLVMPLVAGGTLRERLPRGPMSVAETVALGLTLARALGAAHARGIVHRDLKPENVLYTPDGRPLVADLGLAKHFDREALGGSRSVSLSAHGSMRGTPGYMSPEQVEDARSVGPPSDVFALGAILHECLSGRPAFPGTLVETLARVASATVDPMGRADVPRELQAVLARALARRPGDRFPDGTALARALATFEKPRPGRSRSALLALLAVLAIIIAVAIVATVSWRRERSRALEAATERARLKIVACDWDGAIAESTAALELDPRCGLAFCQRGTARMSKGDPAGALADMDRAVELLPRFAFIWSVRAEARGKLGDLAGVIEDASRAIELEPGNGGAWLLRGKALDARGERARGLAEIERAIALAPDLVDGWMARARIRDEAEDRGGAIEDYSRAIELDPRRALAWYGRGEDLFRKDRVADAIRDFDRAIALGLNEPAAWYNRGFARERSGQDDAAIEDYTRAIAVDPGYVDAWHNRGNTHARREEWEAAAADLRRAVEIEPGRFQAWINLATVLGKLGDGANQLAAASKAVELVPAEPDAWYARASARLATKDREGGVADIERFLELAPPDHRHRADAELRLEQLRAGR